MNASSRLLSIDALRGLTVAAMLMVNNAGDWNHVWPWLEHAAWHGCHPADYIFPMFLFIVGVSFSMATGGALSRGADGAVVWRGAAVRALRLLAIGIALHGIAWALMPGREFRLLGVLQRIGLCFLGVATVAVLCRAAWPRMVATAAVLLGYGLALRLGGGFELADNLATRVDHAVLGGLAYTRDAASGLWWDPEGVLSTLGALGTTLLGLLAGEWLRQRDIGRVWVMAALLMALGAATQALWPWNKALWTPSFVLWTGGVSCAALALWHVLVDRLRAPALGLCMGINAISAYALAWVATCVLEGTGAMAPLYHALFVTPLGGVLPPEGLSALFAVAFTAVFWALMKGFQRMGWRISV